MKTTKPVLAFILLFAGICIQLNAATLEVSNEADSGPGSLRDQIAAAAPGDIINFAFYTVGIHIVLTSGEIVINKDITIHGNGFFHTSIDGNNASRIFNITAGNVTIHGLTIKNGAVNGFFESGGGIANSSTGTVNIDYCIFQSCSAIADGGGIVTNGSINIFACIFDGNHANSDGGGIRTNFGSNVNIEACTFSNNSAGMGGGGVRNSSGTLTLKNTTISGNSAFNGGGFEGPIALINCTVANNHANNVGGGGSTGIPTSLLNSIVSNNTAADHAPDLDGPFVSNGYNIIGDPSSNTGYGPTDMVTNPFLSVLEENGGFTKTISLLCGSPAIDAGDSTTTGNDQRGVGIVGGRRDIGAFESNIPPFVSSCGGTSVTCFGESDGSAVVSATGGGPAPIEYLWSNGATTSSINNLTPATYTATITKANCSLTRSFTVTEPAALVATCSGTNVTCAGGSNGTAAVTFTGGPSTAIGLGSVDGALPRQGSIYFNISDTCDCPPGYVAVGFEAMTGQFINQFNLKCRQLLPDGTLGAAVVNTCTNGTNSSGVPEGPYMSPTDEALVDFTIVERDIPIGIYANSKNIIHIYSGSSNATGLTATGGIVIPGYFFDSYYHQETVPDGNVITGMINYQPEYFYGGSSAVRFRYSPITDVPAPVEYLWSNGATTSSISNLTAGTYTVTVTRGSCSTTASYTVTELSPPLSPTISGNLSFCVGSSTTLNAGNFASYNWSTGATTQTISVNTAAPFSVTVTDANGCTGSTSATTTVNPLPVINISGNLSFCAGSYTTLNVGAFPITNWSTGATTQYINVNTAGTITATVTNSNGCTKSASVSTTINPNPSCTISGSGTICAGASTQWCAPAGLLYNWSNGATTQCITRSATGNYSVTTTDVKGCSSTCNKQLTVGTQLTIDAGVNKIVYKGYADSSCTTLTATGAGGGNPPYTLTWTGGSHATSINVCPTTSTTYFLTITDANNCTFRDSVRVCVFDVRCGSGNKKVTICHGTGSANNPFQTLCILPADAKWHFLNHPGEKLGACGMVKTCGFSTLRESDEEMTEGVEEEMGLTVYPNPAQNEMNVSLHSEVDGKYMLRLVDITGQILLSEIKDVSAGENKYTVNLQSFAPGIYLVLMQSDENILQTRIIKE